MRATSLSNNNEAVSSITSKTAVLPLFAEKYNVLIQFYLLIKSVGCVYARAGGVCVCACFSENHIHIER